MELLPWETGYSETFCQNCLEDTCIGLVWSIFVNQKKKNYNLCCCTQWTLQHEHCRGNSQWIKTRSHQLACLYYHICRHCSELSANTETLKSRYKIFFLQINVFSALFLQQIFYKHVNCHCYHPLARRRMKKLFMQHQ